MDTGSAFLAQSREYLTAHYLPKIRAALAELPESELWWRPHEQANSIGNLLLHLAGNIRQWIVTGVGGAPDIRDRAREFASRDPLTRAELLSRITEAVLEADAVLAATDPASLEERREVQGREASLLAIIYHAVEHFSTHTGQILYITKLRSGRDLGFYRVTDGIARAAWEGRPEGGSA
jgi:uncharacterized damage-inducible protein DinB